MTGEQAMIGPRSSLLIQSCVSLLVASLAIGTIPTVAADSLATPVASPPGGSLAGGRIVFDNNEDIYAIDVDGSSLKQLTNNPGPEFDPMWSPEGTKIVYRDSRRGPNEDDEISVMNADGSDQTNLTHDPANDWGPAWSPDGTRIAFNSTRDNPQLPQVFVMNADGSGVTRLTDREGGYPTWSPDGSRIAFMSSEPAEMDNYEIYVMNADGTDQTRLTNSPGSDGWPAWSPDGSTIVFSSVRDDCRYAAGADCKRSGDIGPFHDLWTMDIDGGNQTRLTEEFGQFVAWSPDGEHLVFGSSGGLFVVAADGSGVRRLPIEGVPGEIGFADWMR
jgi:Tol biopolymer transport system component